MTRVVPRASLCCRSCQQAPPLSMLAEDMSSDGEEDDEGEDEEEGRRL